MRWLIDGYNVIRRDADLRAAEAGGLHTGRAALLRLVAGAARRLTDHFTVVFDGAPGGGPTESPGQVEVIFSRPPEKADDVLIRALTGGDDPADEKDEDEDDDGEPKRGNPRKLSKDARAAQRALRRLRGC